MSKSTLPTDEAIEALAARLDVHRIVVGGQEINPGAAHRVLAAEVSRLAAQNAELAAGLQVMKAWAVKAHAHWDADEDMKAGKILMALAGYLPGYSLDIARAHAVLAELEAGR